MPSRDREGNLAIMAALTTAERLDEFRSRRRELEMAVLALATSVDGARFGFQASLYGLDLAVGGYVTLEDDHAGAARLGQVLSLDAVDVEVSGERFRLARGTGVVLGGPGGAFHDAS